MKGSPLWFPHYTIDAEEADKAAGRDPSTTMANAARVPKDVIQEIGARKINARLTAFRITNPGMDISPLPARSRVVVSDAINYTEEVYLPADCEAVRFDAPAGTVFFVSFHARVTFPIAKNAAPDMWADVLCSPTGWYYVNGKRSISIGLPFSGQAISLGVI